MLYFIHGLNGSSKNWNIFIDYFTALGFDCEAVELKEGLDLKKAHLKDYVNKVCSLVDENDIVIGHSMGGLIMQKVAEQSNIKAGIGICSAPPKGITMERIPWWRQLRYLPYATLGVPFKPSFGLVQDIFLNDMNEQDQQLIYPCLKKQSAHVTVEVMKQKIRIDECQIAAPLYFIGRKNDSIITVDIVIKTAEKYSAPYALVNGNHFIYQDWKPIAKLIYSFITSIR